MQRLPKILVNLLGFNALSAIGGGIGLVTGMLVLPPALLTHTSFTSYVAPGLILGVIVGGSSLFAAITLFVGARQALLLSGGAGLIMTGWIVIEVILIRAFSWLHGLYLVTGLAVTALAIYLTRFTTAQPAE